MKKDKQLEERIMYHQKLANGIKTLQSEEKNVRAELLEEMFGVDIVGSSKAQVGNLIITGEFGLNYKFNQTDLDEAIKSGTLSEEALTGIRVKYELDKKCYDALSEEDTEALNEYLTITPALPTLSVKAAPKED